MATFSVVDNDLSEILHLAAVLANSTIEPSACVGITMTIRVRLQALVFTDEKAPDTGHHQYEGGRGPSPRTHRERVSFAAPPRSDATRCKPFAEERCAHGIRSVLSVPLKAGAETVGGLHFYSREERAFDAGDEALGTAFAHDAAIVIGNALAYWDAQARAEQLAHALESRVVIEQAKGLLMSGGISADAAFAKLRTASQRHNRKVHDIATDIVNCADRRATLA